MLRLLDLFTGYGGFTLAADRLKIETIGFAETDRYATAVLRYRYPNIKNYGDVTSISTKDLPEFDILTGGTPCQDMSIAGTREGLNGKRSGLFYTFTKILSEKLPNMFIWENVKGALSSNKGFDFLEVLNQFSKTGYALQWGVVNSKWFVPQNRERIFVVGYLRGLGRREIFPIEPENTKVVKLGKDISFCLDSNYYKGTNNYNNNRRQLVKEINRIGTLDINGHDYIKRVYGTDGLSPTLPTKTGGGHIPKIMKVGNIYPSGGENGNIYSPDGLSPTLKSGETNNPKSGGIGSSNSPKIVALTETRTEESKEIRKKVQKEEGKDFSPRRGKKLVPRKDELSNCITSGQTKEHLITDFTKIRRLTPIECERLQGLEDNYTKYGVVNEIKIEISDTQRYKLLGNGVTIDVVEEILRRML